MFFSEITEKISKGQKVLITGLASSAKGFLIAEISSTSDIPLAVIVENNRTADNLRKDLHSIGYPNVEVFASLDYTPYTNESPHPEKIMERASAIGKMLTGGPDILLIPASSLCFVYPCLKELINKKVSLTAGKEHPPENLNAFLAGSGYRKQDIVTEKGEFCFRGGIADIFPPSYECPVRIEYFGDVVNSVRHFDQITQRSTEQVRSCDITPINMVVLNSHIFEKWQIKAEQMGCSSEEFREYSGGVRLNGFMKNSDFFLRLFEAETANLFEWLSGYYILSLCQNRIVDIIKETRDEILSFHSKSTKSFWLKPSVFLAGQEELEEALIKDVHLAECESSDPEEAINLMCEPAPHFGGSIQRLLHEVSNHMAEGGVVYISCCSEGRLHRLDSIFEDAGISSAIMNVDSVLTGEKGISSLFLLISSYSRGFSFRKNGIHFITEQDIFGEENRLFVPPKNTVNPFFSDFRDIKTGSFLVHIDHGIGVFRGLKTLTVDNNSSEFLELEYGGGAKLYVPAERLDLLQKFSHTEDARPALDKLGGISWERKKNRIRKSMKDMTEKLLKLYAERDQIRGHSFSEDSLWQKEFEDSFPYRETPDQIISIKEIKADMENSLPMDRLLCGDVGFGKTEVAMRAAFKAVMDGKQVAVIAPTTVLSFQHYNTFTSRFSCYPATIEFINRFKSKKEITETLSNVSKGKTDILIGTHRLLSKDVVFKDLGLLIIDEEQRFGVEHKEKLKGMFKNIDVLTLTATPIPRTLHMSFAGIRDISILQTPPDNRMTIHTSVIPFDVEALQHAVNREIERGGQVYIVNNTIKGLDPLAELVRKLVPEASIIIAHGQMPEDRLESAMISFMRNDGNVLITTTIIENGIDLPSVNTIIVNRAETFGLAQLYQLRGRVGRSDIRAYAYLFFPQSKTLSEIARKRLNAIQEFSLLGSGFRLAAMDMEIRGTGNLLGAEQSGHMNSIGFETYIRLLKETSAEITGESVPIFDRPSIKLGIDALIPENYIRDSSQRIGVYKRIAQAVSKEELQSIRDELEDMFGTLPLQADSIFSAAGLCLEAAEVGIESIERGKDGLFFKFRNTTKVQPEKITDIVKKSRYASFVSPNCVKFATPFQVKDYLSLSAKILKQIS